MHSFKISIRCVNATYSQRIPIGITIPATVWWIYDQIFIDDAILDPTPSKTCFNEASAIFPSHKIDGIFSIGIGTSQISPLKFGNLSCNPVTNALESWDDLLKEVGENVAKNCFRLNPTLSEEYQLDDAHKISEVEKDAKQYLNNNKEIVLKACNHLLASLFYFSFKIVSENKIHGEIQARCSLPSLLQQRLQQCVEPRAFSSPSHGVEFSWDKMKCDPDFQLPISIPFQQNVTLSILCHVSCSIESQNQCEGILISGCPFLLNILEKKLINKKNKPLM